MEKTIMAIDGVATPSGPPAQVRARIARHLRKRGFTAAASAPAKTMTFTRGSAFTGLTRFNPGKCKAVLTITQNEEQFATLFEVSRPLRGGMEDIDRNYWTAESLGLADVIEGREPKLEETDKRASGTGRQAMLAAGRDGFLFGLGFFALGAIMWKLGGREDLPLTLSRIGAMIGIGRGFQRVLLPAGAGGVVNSAGDGHQCETPPAR